jgi:isopropylmalate/homocitrate/citramalate synthase
MTPPDVLISEVGPRDGLQSVKATMPTADKLRWIDALYAAGVREIEVASFVPAKLLPQMADAADVVRHAITLPGLTVMALVPNRKGAQAALEAGVHKLTMPVSASVAHSLANVRKTPTEMVEEVRAIAELRRAMAPQVKLEAGISTAFGCTLQGLVPEDDVIRLAAQCIEAGADESGLSDTVGYANPAQVRRLFKRLRAELGGMPARPTCTTRAASASRTAWPHGTRACAPSTPRSAASAAARTRPAPRATPSPKTSCSCSRPWACAPASTSRNSSRRARRSWPACPANRSTA